MDRRSALWVILAAAAGAWGMPRISSASKPAWLDPEVLKAALRTATPEEEGFIAYVIGLVESGRLPPAIVQSAYLYAKKKPKRQFQYFKRAVIELAAARGIRL